MPRPYVSDYGRGEMSDRRHEAHPSPPAAVQAALVAIAFDGDDLHVVRDVITLPVRIAVWATRLGFHVAGEAVTAALRTTERLVESAAPARGGPGAPVDREVSGGVRVDVVDVEPAPISQTPSTPPRAPTARRPTTEPRAPARVPEDVEPTPPPPTAGAPNTKPAVPAHVSEQVEFVESFAESGAEDGVGAAVHVEEPWKGYRQMTAKQVIARLADASREELGTVELYEGAHRGRQTILLAADRQLQRATAAARQRK